MKKTIKKIKILKSKVVITFSDNDKLEIDKSVYPNFYLYEGKELSAKELKALNELNNASSFLNYALKLREKNAYTERKMREKLYQKGATKAITDSVINSLKRSGLIDDEQYIKDHIEYYNSLNYGKNKIKNKLIEKGIDIEKVEKIIFPISVERKKANNLLNKFERKYAKYNDAQKKQHIYQAYLSSGFDIDIAKEMIEKITPSKEKEEKSKLEEDFNKAYNKYSRKCEKKELRNKLLSHLVSKGYKFKDVIEIIERKKI